METIDHLLQTFRRQTQLKNPEKLRFMGVAGYDVYNPSTPFYIGSHRYLLGRVEKRTSEHAYVGFFKHINHLTYALDSSRPTYELQDPFITRIHDEWVLGGTYVDWAKSQWFTRVYKGRDIDQLTHWFDAPTGMKDVRVLELNDGSIGIFTRPQGGHAGKGKIGFVQIPSFDSITQDILTHARLLDLFEDEVWGGVNACSQRTDGTIDVTGHIAYFTEPDIRHYYAMRFVFDAAHFRVDSLEIIAERSQYLPGPAKRDDLYDVLFTSGITQESGKMFLYVGTSDCEVQRAELEPLKYEETQ